MLVIFGSPCCPFWILSCEVGVGEQVSSECPRHRLLHYCPLARLWYPSLIHSRDVPRVRKLSSRDVPRMNQGWLSLEIQNWILGTGTLLSLMSSLEFFFWFLGTSLEFRNWILGTGTFLSLLSSLELISSCDKQLKKWSCHSVCLFVRLSIPKETLLSLKRIWSDIGSEGVM